MTHLLRKSLPLPTALLAVSLGACTTLGPMPATTGIAMAPAGRPELEVRGGYVPGYFLSSAVREEASGAPLSEVSAIVEPDRLLHLPGLFVGARYAGSPGQGAALEPTLGYRTALGAERQLGLGVVGYGTHASGSDKRASFEATRAGLEAGGDYRLTPRYEYVELHANASAALTGVTASGRYCSDASGKYATDCPDEANAVTDTSASAGGLYPSVSAGLSLDFARHLDSAFHGMRLGLGVSGGTMPRVIAGQQASARPYVAAGGTLSVAFGAAR